MADDSICHFYLAHPMIIRNIEINNFRNFSGLKATFESGANIFFGDNGSGKTNFLEALFVLCLGRSQLGAADNVLIKQDSDYYRLEGEVVAGDNRHRVAVAYQRGNRRRLVVDGIPARPSELFERFCAVSTGPEDSVILSGPPGARRMFLDMYLSQLSPRYLLELTDYHRVLSQKNAALKNEMDAAPFEPLLINHGARVMLQRVEYLNALRELSRQYYAEIAGGEKFTLRYEPSVNLPYENITDPGEIELAFQRTLDEHYEKEAFLRTAIVGPHRDEIFFEIAGLPARTYGSQGQWRTAAIALKLGVYHLLKARRGGAPLLLLDEIFAELDGNRCSRLIELFGEFSQLFLTTATTPPPQLMANGCCYKIVKGTIENVG